VHVVLRRAEERDLPSISALAAEPSVEPFLMPGAGDLEALRALLERGPLGLFVIEAGGEPTGAVALDVVGQRSRLCQLSRLMVDPRRRGLGIASRAVHLAARLALVEIGLHRVQTEVYGDNVISQRLFDRVGFTREGVRRQAYWRRGRWLDGVIYGLLADELRGDGYGGARPGRAEPR
jgi:RimJ/RimL family protein N-acetyltransferase